MHYQKFFEINKVNLRKTWEGIKEILNIKQTKGQIINALNNGDDIISETRKVQKNSTTISAKLRKQ